jgi:serine/threonine-protein kinase
VVDRLASALAGRYRIERELGAGGMATVYLAHDEKHGRDVAIKVIHPDLGAALGGERFLAEIRTTAKLQHPHILPLLDSGDAGDGLLYYVMPFVKGETLRDRLERERQLPVADAVRLAREVASALDYAHREGVVHRDIKPENILLQDGNALVADFGIALAVQSAAGQRMTQTGLSLGTPQYMSPEQAMGERTLDARSDVYALGAVTYEMLAGEPPFTGPTVQAIVARLIAEEPRPLSVQRRAIPAHVEGAVLGALEKLPADRFPTAAAFAAALGGTGELRSGARAAPPARDERAVRRWRTIALAAAAVAALAIGAAAWSARSAGTGPDDEGARVAFGFDLGEATVGRPRIAISRDGRVVALVVIDSSGRRRIMVRALDDPALVAVPGTEGANSSVAISPDGRWLAFDTPDGRVRRVRVEGGPSTVLAERSYNSALSWGSDGWIYYSAGTGADAGLWRVRESGGGAERLTRLDPARREFAHWAAGPLPGGRALLFASYTVPVERSRIDALDLETKRRVPLVEDAMQPSYVDGHLLFVRGTTLFAVPFDAERLALTGEAVPVLQELAASATDGSGGYAVSHTGTLVYLRRAEWAAPSRVLWVGRDGTEQGVVAQDARWSEPRLSPDGRRIALTRSDSSASVWLFDAARRALTQLSPPGAYAFSPVWMPDGRALLHVIETPVYDIARAPIDGSATDTVVRSPLDKMLGAVSGDGRTMAYFEIGGVEQVRFVPLVPGTAMPGVPPGAPQRNPVFSPDGHWLAVEELAPGKDPEVFVRPIGGTARRQVSVNGGSQPRFTRGGREIVFRRGAELLAAPFDPTTGEAGAPVTLFRRRDIGRFGGARTVGYDVTPDGSRFLVVEPVVHPGALPVAVITHWLPELRRAVRR